MNNLESQHVASEALPRKLSGNEHQTVDNDDPVDFNVEMVPPDGGWGWMVLFGSFIIMTLGAFPLYAFSIIFSPVLMSKGVSSTKIAWIFNFYQLIWCFYVILIGPLCEQFGSRKVGIFGGLAAFLSLILSAFVPTPDYLFITFALPGGITTASGYVLGSLVTSNYFKKHLGFAVGILSMGDSLSSFISPVIANYLLQNYGFIGAAIISGAFVMNQCVGASLYQPLKWHMKPEKISSMIEKKSEDFANCNREPEEISLQVKPCRETQTNSDMSEVKNNADKVKLRNQKISQKFMNVFRSTINNLKIIKYMRVHLIAWFYWGLIFGFTNFQLWIPFIITSKGHSLEMAAWCSSLSSIGNVIGRILMSLLADRKFFNVSYGFMFGQFLMGSSIIAFSLIEDINHFKIVIFCFGIGVGLTFSSFITVMIKLMGIKMLPAVLGTSSIYRGLSAIIIGPLIGAVRDATQSYTNVLWMLGGFEFMGVLMLLLMPFGEKFDNWNMRRLERKKNKKLFLPDRPNE